MNEFSSAIIAALSMILTLDEDLVEIVLLSLQVSLGAVTIAAVIALPLGALIALQNFPGRRGVFLEADFPIFVARAHRLHPQSLTTL